MNITLSELAARLAMHREEKKLTLADVSRHLRIKAEYLERLEQADTTFLPAAYTASMLRRYAEFLNVPVDLVEQCRAELAPKSFVDPEPIAPAAESSELAARYYLLAKKIVPAFLMLAVIATAAFFGLKQFGLLGESAVVIHRTVQLPAAPAPKPEGPQPSAMPVALSQIPSPPPETTAASVAAMAIVSAKNTSPVASAIAPATSGRQSERVATPTMIPMRSPVSKKLSLVIRAKADSCWLRVQPDRFAPVQRAFLRPYQTRAFEADSSFSITIGRVQAVDVMLNGKSIAFDQKYGALHDYELTDR
ncbi:MAG: DUF4115 domain-containing protein [Rhizobacter sp.]|nr:DUF4115 domain-containing protein [Chlorobiales bacterium]